METESERRIRSCPRNGKICCEGIREDFKVDPYTKQKIKCRSWIHLYGKDPQSEKTIDQFDCAEAWGPILLTEISQMIRHLSAQVSQGTNVFVSALPPDTQQQVLECQKLPLLSKKNP